MKSKKLPVQILRALIRQSEIRCKTFKSEIAWNLEFLTQSLAYEKKLQAKLESWVKKAKKS